MYHQVLMALSGIISILVYRHNKIHYCYNVILCAVINQRGVLINMQSCTNTKILYCVHQELIGVMKGVREHVVNHRNNYKHGKT